MIHPRKKVNLSLYISNLDNRWNVIEQSVDDRKPTEKINKSRYSSISTFIHPLGDNYIGKEGDLTFDSDYNIEYWGLTANHTGNNKKDEYALYISFLNLFGFQFQVTQQF